MKSVSKGIRPENKQTGEYNFRRTPQQIEIIHFSSEAEVSTVSKEQSYDELVKESQPSISHQQYLDQEAFINWVINTRIGKDCSRHPVIIKGLDIGSCTSKWTEEYLKHVSPTKLVKVHRSHSAQLDFRNKNFKYQTIPFGELIDNCSRPTKCDGSNSKSIKEQQAEPEADNGHVKQERENNEDVEETFYYLRSLGDDPRGKDISDLSIHFPELYKDIRIPPLFPQPAFFSSVFRITSPTLQLWTHYDTCDNILIQIKGRKRIVFFPPWEALNLYLDGDKSEVIDIDNPDPNLYPNFLNIERIEGVLEEGDIVFIPALWFHNITALNFSISVNVFWQNLEKDKYDKKDTYGNHDVIPAQLGFRTLDKATSQLKVLPLEYQDFYLRRMIVSLQKRLSNIGQARLTESEKEKH